MEQFGRYLQAVSYDLINPRRVVTEGVAQVPLQPLETLVDELRRIDGLEPTGSAEDWTEAQPVAEITVYGPAHDHATWHANNAGWSEVLYLLDARDAVPQGAYDYGDNSGWQVSAEESQRMAAAVRAHLGESAESGRWLEMLEDLAAFLEQAAQDDGFEVW